MPEPRVTRNLFRPLNAGGDIAARCPYLGMARAVSPPPAQKDGFFAGLRDPLIENFQTVPGE
jgi:hypothetical protein